MGRVIFNEAILPADDFKPSLPEFLFDFVDGHFMVLRSRSHQSSLGRKRFTIDHNQTPSGNQRIEQVRNDGVRIGEFMVCVRNQNGVHALPGHARIAGFAKKNAYVAFSSLDRPDPQKRERQPANVFRQNAATRANWIRKFEREVTGTTSQIKHYVSGLQIKRLENFVWLLPFVSFSLNGIQPRECLQTLVSRVE